MRRFGFHHGERVQRTFIFALTPAQQVFAAFCWDFDFAMNSVLFTCSQMDWECFTMAIYISIENIPSADVGWQCHFEM